MLTSFESAGFRCRPSRIARCWFASLQHRRCVRFIRRVRNGDRDRPGRSDHTVTALGSVLARAGCVRYGSHLLAGAQQRSRRVLDARAVSRPLPRPGVRDREGSMTVAASSLAVVRLSSGAGRPRHPNWPSTASWPAGIATSIYFRCRDAHRVLRGGGAGPPQPDSAAAEEPSTSRFERGRGPGTAWSSPYERN